MCLSRAVMEQSKFLSCMHPHSLWHETYLHTKLTLTRNRDPWFPTLHSVMIAKDNTVYTYTIYILCVSYIDIISDIYTWLTRVSYIDIISDIYTWLTRVSSIDIISDIYTWLTRHSTVHRYEKQDLYNFITLSPDSIYETDKHSITIHVVIFI